MKFKQCDKNNDPFIESTKVEDLIFSERALFVENVRYITHVNLPFSSARGFLLYSLNASSLILCTESLRGISQQVDDWETWLIKLNDGEETNHE